MKASETGCGAGEAAGDSCRGAACQVGGGQAPRRPAPRSPQSQGSQGRALGAGEVILSAADNGSARA